MPAKTQTLFVYGTLMHPPVFEKVTGNKPGEMRKARLPGFQRSRLEGVTFPGIVPSTGHSTDGLLVAVDGDALSLLDAFEGSWYDRAPVVVEAGDGQAICAEVYVTSQVVRHLITGEPWDFKNFLSVDLHSFLND